VPTIHFRVKFIICLSMIYFNKHLKAHFVVTKKVKKKQSFVIFITSTLVLYYLPLVCITNEMMTINVIIITT
jgi:hypothetical protein